MLFLYLVLGHVRTVGCDTVQICTFHTIDTIIVIHCIATCGKWWSGSCDIHSYL